MKDFKKLDASEIFYGRRRSRSLGISKDFFIQNYLPCLEIDLNVPPRVPFEAFFGSDINQVRLEIGFGRGENLLHRALLMPHSGFIGVEPFMMSMVKFIKNLQEKNINNIRVYNDNAVKLLDWLPNTSIDDIYLLYPDPWPKKRHWKRRFISEINLNRFSRVLKPGGVFYFVSDVESYINWTLLAFCNHLSFQWLAEESLDWSRPFPNWTSTYYEAKGKLSGRTPTYLAFQRV
ncbi:tRNA (guanine46-N7-)-methyltransferase [Liberibacter crescens BT-1]|uniref:tRNA (guanine-N(7)-)-methyltransferase n=1 Tax=Liberibacter crescens (strain BT-1) TaxID=1215343 RepID=L0EUU8_LIBCB|nr:tRNA (guanosine(46)-N7)-methyltransferase TrmB [Liberibacter crescens]AGA64156.1 tRNA (guanine46-N7-)-methyltransferase [Liberibacter crescens BT-1]AMC12422.1 tRNA (guanine-N7)-methyltransferase [Liberibacter crescens]